MKSILPYLACVASVVAQPAPPPAEAPPGEEGAPVEEVPFLPPAEVADAEPVPAPPAARARTISKSRQFVIHGSNFATRGAIAALAEETREKLEAELGADPDWEHSIAIQLHGAQGDPVPARTLRWRPFEVQGGFRLQLDVHLAKGKPSGLERAILHLLLIERGLRGKGAERIETALTVPPWLLDGFLESFRWKDGERDHALYEALFEKSQLFPVKQLLEINDPGGLDSMARAAYRGSSGALVMALLSQSGGKAAMQALLKEAATFEGDEMALLVKHFPGMNLGKESFSKWWALQLASMSETPFLQVLPIVETEEELTRLLVVRFQDAEGAQYEVGPDQFRDLLALDPEQRNKALLPVVEKTGQFLYRAFPAHREIVVEYLRILGEISTDIDTDIEARIASLAAQRDELRALGERTRDYLEWYRITNAKQLSGDFESFMELKSGLAAPRSHRQGPISRYLDDVQRVLQDTREGEDLPPQ